jgi:hypothetical protein
MATHTVDVGGMLTHVFCCCSALWCVGCLSAPAPGVGNNQLTDVEDLTNIRICIATVVDQEVGGKMLAATPTPAAPEANKMEVPALTEKEKVCSTVEDSTLQPVCVCLSHRRCTHTGTRAGRRLTVGGCGAMDARSAAASTAIV